MSTAKRIGKYDIVSRVSRGPRAAVYRGTDSDDQRPVVIKVIPRTLTTTWRAQGLVGGALSGSVVTTTTTYSPIAGSAAADRLTAYPMGAWSELKLPDTSANG